MNGLDVILQLCTLGLNKDGYLLRWEDDSKSLQASVFLRPEVRPGEVCTLHDGSALPT